MRRREFISILGDVAMAWAFAAHAQQPMRVHRVGILFPSTPTLLDTLKKEFRDLGYNEGQNLVIDLRWAEGRAERLPILAAELVALKPDAILTFTTNGALAAKQATTTIPIVMMLVSDPVGSGLIARFAHPGGNVTGVTDYGVDLAGKFVELVHDVAPKATRIAVLMSDNPIHPTQLKGIEDAAKGFGLTVLPTMDRSTEELEQAFASLAKEGAEAIIVLGGATQAYQRERIAELASKLAVPTVSVNRLYVERGGLMSYGPNLPSSLKLAAQYVDKILKGANPGDLPVMQPPRFELVINLKTANALGITIPPSIMVRADEVIE
jgi:putative ABC transport system substrate-binding protein